VDVRLDAAGVPRFIEVNPLAGLRPLYSDLAIIARLAGLSYADLVGHIVESACLRLRQDGGESAPDPS
jgi:D-alanine-D-alanine ligase